MPQGIRFKPPNLPMPKGVNWALTRAFGPLENEATDGTCEERLSAAQRLGLIMRIFARHPSSRLQTELGEKTAQRISTTVRNQIAKGLLLQNVQRQTEQLAQLHQIRLVELKFAALAAKGLATAATRAACDLDLLVAERDLLSLAEALGTLGFRKLDVAIVKHQPIVVTRDDGANIELHVGIPYLQANPRNAFATLDELVERRLVIANPSYGNYVYLPTDAVLAAHLIAHGIVQHGFEPKTYPSLRLISDLIDFTQSRLDGLLPEISALIGSVVTSDELRGLRSLVSSLINGTHATVFNDDSPEGLLLRHFVLSTLDERYRAKALLLRMAQSAREEGLLALTKQLVKFAFALPDEHLHKLYPKVRHPLTARLIRPFDFVWRGIRRVVRASR